MLEEIANRSGQQLHTPEHAQFQYASNALSKIAPFEIYDIGSHRSWLYGLSAAYKVHTLDVRPPSLTFANEIFHHGVAENLPFESESVECLTSLCSLEHFGLGCYGDPYDPQADLKAIAEMKRVLKRSGHLILTTTCTGGEPFIVYNTLRVYSLSQIHRMLSDMELVDEQFYSIKLRRFIPSGELIRVVGPRAFDIYCGTWTKP